MADTATIRAESRGLKERHSVVGVAGRKCPAEDGSASRSAVAPACPHRAICAICSQDSVLRGVICGQRCASLLSVLTVPGLHANLCHLRPSLAICHRHNLGRGPAHRRYLRPRSPVSSGYLRNLQSPQALTAVCAIHATFWVFSGLRIVPRCAICARRPRRAPRPRVICAICSICGSRSAASATRAHCPPPPVSFACSEPSAAQRCL